MQNTMAHQREFELRKEVVLKALKSEEKDKSRKGGVDAPIADLIGCINSHPSFFTTSSCSGRVSIFLERPAALLNSDPYHAAAEGAQNDSGSAGGAAKTKAKQGGRWMYVTHEPAKADDVVETVRRLYEEETEPDGLLMFRFEPFILALECSSLTAGQRIVACAMASGYRESGMSSVGKRIIVAVRSSIRLEVPIGEKGRLLVPEEYLQFLTASANRKFLLNHERIIRFMSTFIDHFDGEIDPALTEPMAALNIKAEPRRRTEMSSHLRDKLLSSLAKRQSKILLRIESLETHVNRNGVGKENF